MTAPKETLDFRVLLCDIERKVTGVRLFRVEGVVVQLNFVFLNSTEDHPAKAAISDGQRLVPVGSRGWIP